MDLLNIDYRKKLIAEAEKHKRATGRSFATIGKLLVNDNDFLERIKRGGGCTVDTFQKSMRWFLENTPKTKRKRSN